MENHNSTGNAAAVAAQFEVAELEPRQENIWAGADVESPTPGGPDGTHSDPGGVQ